MDLYMLMLEDIEIAKVEDAKQSNEFAIKKVQELTRLNRKRKTKKLVEHVGFLFYIWCI